MGTTDMPEIRAPPFHNHLNDCVVVFKNVKGSSAITNRQARVGDQTKKLKRIKKQNEECQKEGWNIEKDQKQN